MPLVQTPLTFDHSLSKIRGYCKTIGDAAFEIGKFRENIISLQNGSLSIVLLTFYI